MCKIKENKRKSEKYQDLPPCYMFSPIAIETLGVTGPNSLTLLKELGRHIKAKLDVPKSTEYLLQWLSVATSYIIILLLLLLLNVIS